MFNIALYQPDIPQNTAAIVRTCSCLGIGLEIIEPCGFFLTDPRFKSKYWRNEIELQLEINKKSEQQALAKYGLDFVTNTYLPEKLKEMNIG